MNTLLQYSPYVLAAYALAAGLWSALLLGLYLQYRAARRES